MPTFPAFPAPLALTTLEPLALLTMLTTSMAKMAKTPMLLAPPAILTLTILAPVTQASAPRRRRAALQPGRHPYWEERAVALSVEEPAWGPSPPDHVGRMPTRPRGGTRQAQSRRIWDPSASCLSLMIAVIGRFAAWPVRRA